MAKANTNIETKERSESKRTQKKTKNINKNVDSKTIAAVARNMLKKIRMKKTKNKS